MFDSPIVITLITVIGISLLLYLIYKFFEWLEKGIIRVEEFMTAAHKETLVPSGKFITFSQPNNGFSFSTQIWMYIKDFNYKYGYKKPVYTKGGFVLSIDDYNNNLTLEVPIYSSSTPARLVYENLPIQKWLHVVILVENRNIDLWINGELYQSKHLENFPKVFENDPARFTPEGGFHGYLCNIIHYEYPISKAKVIELFKIGPIDNSLLALLRRFFMNTLGFSRLMNMKLSLKVSISATGDSDTSGKKSIANAQDSVIQGSE